MDNKFAPLLQEHNLRCGICRQPFAKPGDIRVDHDHKTGKARGLLCNHCNVGLGFFRDRPGFLESAYHYLRLHQGKDLKQVSTVFVTETDLCHRLRNITPEQLNTLVMQGDFPPPYGEVNDEAVWHERDLGGWWARQRRSERERKRMLKEENK